MAAVAHADVALYKICVKIETYVGNVLSSTKKDCLSNHLAVDDGKLKWHGSLEELKKFLNNRSAYVANGHRQADQRKSLIYVKPNSSLVLHGTQRSSVRWYFKAILRLRN